MTKTLLALNGELLNLMQVIAFHLKKFLASL